MLLPVDMDCHESEHKPGGGDRHECGARFESGHEREAGHEPHNNHEIFVADDLFSQPYYLHLQGGRALLHAENAALECARYFS